MSRTVHLPVTLNLSGRRVLFVGGGQAAVSKLKALDPFRPNLTLVAPIISPEVVSLVASWPEVALVRREFLPEDLEGMTLAWIFTDNLEVNRQAATLARSRGVLVNVAGDPDRDFTNPACAVLDDVILAVSSGGRDIAKAVTWRDRFREFWGRWGE